MMARHAPLFLLFLFACSAPEGANHAARCDALGQCADGRVCYRGFCVLDETVPGAPQPDADADADADAMEPDAMGPPSDVAGADAGTPDPSVGRDAGAGLDAGSDAALEEPTDARVAAPPTPDAEALPGTLPDAAADVSDAAAPDAAGTDDEDDAALPPADAATGGADPAEVSRALGLCLVACRSNNNRCYSCFRALVEEYPEVCDDPSEDLLQSLCTLLCAVPGCGER